MNEARTASDALIQKLRSSIAAEGRRSISSLVLYTSFGVVRGHLSLSLVEELSKEGGEDSHLLQHVIEISEATVEHYSNHLPTASFDRLCVRLDQVQGFALVSSRGQS